LVGVSFTHLTIQRGKLEDYFEGGTLELMDGWVDGWRSGIFVYTSHHPRRQTGRLLWRTTSHLQRGKLGEYFEGRQMYDMEM
jgi:hypothetical protein